MTQPTTRLIETDFPLRAVSEESVCEKGVRRGFSAVDTNRTTCVVLTIIPPTVSTEGARPLKGGLCFFYEPA